MYDQHTYFPVNWIDGMKINKDHFIAQDNAMSNALHISTSAGLSSMRYGLLLPPSSIEPNFRVNLAVDNQRMLTVTVLQCLAVTRGGVFIHIDTSTAQVNGSATSGAFPIPSTAERSVYYAVLIVHPFDRQPAGNPDLSENPPRFPFTQPIYQVEVVDAGSYRQLAHNPYALTIGRVLADGNSITVDEEFIPPCVSINAHPDLLQLHAELDQFLATLELRCSIIVQKIFKRNQQTKLSELALFLCDRVMLYMAQALTNMRRTIPYEPPIALFAIVSGLARAMKNTIDLRIGSGKDDLMNYLSKWSEQKQGELEAMLSRVANLSYNHNNINESIPPVVEFGKVITKLFETLSNLEFIDQQADDNRYFIKEDKQSRRGFFKGP